MKKKFNIKFTKPIVGKRFGVFQHIMKGAGSEKVDMRKYSSGDSASQINRKRSAKYQELYTNVFQQEKSLVMDIFLDINYNRRGGKIPNREQAFSYTEDILSYCKQQQIAVTMHYPTYRRRGTSTLVHKDTKQHMREFRTMIEAIFAQVKTTKPYYTSRLHDFLRTAVKNKKRRALVLFSDFLTMDDEAKQLIDYLKKHHILFLFQLPIDPDYGQNYEQFLLNFDHKKNNGNTVFFDERIVPATGEIKSTNEVKGFQNSKAVGEKKTAPAKKPSGEIELL